MTALSILDLSPICADGTAADALRNTRDLARHAEDWGYRRYWLAEHHNMPGIASAATSLVISHVAAATRTMRVGAGGIMLPNHSPLVIAEQFGTLASLYPGRIDLGLGRAPGSDQATARALRRHDQDSADRFPQDVAELQAYFQPARPGQAVQAVPGAGLDVPLWLLGSSLFSAQLAAQMGLPFAFASHFAPGYMSAALDLYRTRFQPSAALQQPYVMLGLNVFAAPTRQEAARLFTSLQQQFVSLIRGTPGKLPPPVDDMDAIWSGAERAHVERALACTVVGDPAQVEAGMRAFAERTGADELMITAPVYDHAARLASFHAVAKAGERIGPPPARFARSL
ncbi:Limonene 1,2-monooxygenase [Pigmentiphaga humi]|uniref:Luciferase-like monooxygenase n=1 Tax=Pigmentiphaga humi TaxID=2478468 RepID=A0A3P4B607_9BURK|nr:LLM class flavin-dependent oxidoreductase [Pigmentiphaga humi]VCU71729.1 Limonene 1,2-monooxygenase [Pigmentiphaga humi]